MNVRRGLFRLWVVFAVLWVGGAVVAHWSVIDGTYRPMKTAPPDFVASNGVEIWKIPEAGAFDDLVPRDPKGRRMVPDEEAYARAVTDGAAAAILPPIALLLLGAALAWAFSGFSRR